MNNRKESILYFLKPYLLIFFSLIFFLSPLYFKYFPLSIIFFPFSLTPLLIGFYKYHSKFLSNIVILFLIIIGFLLFFSSLIKLNLSVVYSYIIAFIVLSIIPSLLFEFSRKNNFTLQFTYSLYIYYTLFLLITVIILLHTDYFSHKVSQFFIEFDMQFNSYIAELKKQNFSEEVIQQQIINKMIAINIIKNYYAALLFISLIMYFTINIGIGFVIISRYFLKKPIFLKLFEIKVNEHLIWAFILSWALLFIFLNLHLEKFSRIAWNISIIISTLYFLQGVSIFLFRFLFFRIPFFIKAFLLFLFFYAFLRFLLIGSILFMGIGVLDLWLDFRKFHTIDIDKLV